MSTLNSASAIPPDASRRGTVSTASAFMLWGLLPIYWKMLDTVPALQILSHRTIWSLVFLLVLLFALKRMGEVKAALRSKRNLRCLAGGSLLLAANWGIYIWAVTNGHIIEASLGYYITPLINVVLGCLVFKDSLNRVRLAAIALAVIGVAVMVVRYGHFPWLALSIALSFALYGMIRKLAAVESMPGLFLETAVMTPFMAVYLLWRENLGVGAFLHSGLEIDGLLLLSGVATSVPLLLFAYGARRISFITVGLLQYITPTMTFLLGCLVYGETFRPSHALGFTCIWLALALYTFDGVRRYKYSFRADNY